MPFRHHSKVHCTNKDKTMNPSTPTTQMTTTRGNEFLSAKNNFGDVELRNLEILGIGNAVAQNLNKVTVYTADYNTTPQQIQVPGQSEIAYIEKIVFIDEKTFVLTTRAPISPTVLKGIGRTFATKMQPELPHYDFIGDLAKIEAKLPVYAYAIRMTQKPQVFVLSTAEDGYRDIQVTPAENNGEVVISAFDKDGITLVLQNLSLQTSELKKLNWSLAAKVQLPEGIRPISMINVRSQSNDQVIHLFGTNKGVYRHQLLNDATEMVPGTEDMKIEWLTVHTATNTIFASTRNAQNEVEFLGINEIFTDKFEAFTWKHSTDMVPQTELGNVKALSGPITEIGSNPGILLAWPQANEEQSYAYATQTLELAAAV